MAIACVLTRHPHPTATLVRWHEAGNLQRRELIDASLLRFYTLGVKSYRNSKKALYMPYNALRVLSLAWLTRGGRGFWDSKTFWSR